MEAYELDLRTSSGPSDAVIFFALDAVQFVWVLPQVRDLSGANCGVSKLIQNFAKIVNRP